MSPETEEGIRCVCGRAEHEDYCPRSLLPFEPTYEEMDDTEEEA